RRRMPRRSKRGSPVASEPATATTRARWNSRIISGCMPLSSAAARRSKYSAATPSGPDSGKRLSDGSLIVSAGVESRGSGERLPMALLFRVRRTRHHDAGHGEKVAEAPAALRQAFARETELGAGFGAAGDADLHFAMRGAHGHGRAEDGLP